MIGGTLSIGNIVTIFIFITGLFIQYFSLVRAFEVRITKLEVTVELGEKYLKKDLNSLGTKIRELEGLEHRIIALEGENQSCLQTNQIKTA